MNDRLDRYKKGHWAETLAAFYLRCKFYRVLAKRFKTRYGEVDLIASRGRTLVFVEVKARADRRTGLEAILPKSQQRIQAAAQTFVQRHKQFQHYDWRFDALVVSPRSWPYHLKNAWRA